MRRNNYLVLAAMMIGAIGLYIWHPVAGGAGLAVAVAYTWAKGL